MAELVTIGFSTLALIGQVVEFATCDLREAWLLLITVTALAIIPLGFIVFFMITDDGSPQSQESEQPQQQLSSRNSASTHDRATTPTRGQRQQRKSSSKNENTQRSENQHQPEIAASTPTGFLQSMKFCAKWLSKRSTLSRLSVMGLLILLLCFLGGLVVKFASLPLTTSDQELDKVNDVGGGSSCRKPRYLYGFSLISSSTPVHASRDRSFVQERLVDRDEYHNVVLKSKLTHACLKRTPHTKEMDEDCSNDYTSLYSLNSHGNLNFGWSEFTSNYAGVKRVKDSEEQSDASHAPLLHRQRQLKYVYLVPIGTCSPSEAAVNITLVTEEVTSDLFPRQNSQKLDFASDLHDLRFSTLLRERGNHQHITKLGSEPNRRRFIVVESMKDRQAKQHSAVNLPEPILFNSVILYRTSEEQDLHSLKRQPDFINGHVTQNLNQGRAKEKASVRTRIGNLGFSMVGENDHPSASQPGEDLEEISRIQDRVRDSALYLAWDTELSPTTN